MGDPKVEAELLAYVREEEPPHGPKEAGLRLAAQQLATGHRLDRYGLRIRALERVVFHGAPVHGPMMRPPAVSLPDPDDTQRHQIVDLERALAEQKAAIAAEGARRLDSMIWWKRRRWTWAVGAAGAVALIVLSALVTLAITHIH